MIDYSVSKIKLILLSYYFLANCFLREQRWRGLGKECPRARSSAVDGGKKGRRGRGLLPQLTSRAKVPVAGSEGAWSQQLVLEVGHATKMQLCSRTALHVGTRLVRTLGLD